MAYSTIINAAKTQVETVDAVRNVYTFWRNVRYLSTLRETFLDTDNRRIHTWMFTRSSATHLAEAGTGASREHNFDLHGYYQVNDSEESELTFQGIVDDVMQALNTIPSSAFDDTGRTFLVDLSILVEMDTLMLCGVLCHHALIKFVATEDVDP